MYHPPEPSTPADRLAHRLAMASYHLSKAQAECVTIGMSGLEDDLAQCWQWILRLESDIHTKRYHRPRGCPAPRVRSAA